MVVMGREGAVGAYHIALAQNMFTKSRISIHVSTRSSGSDC